MLCLDDDGDTRRLQYFHQRIGDLHSQLLLDLQPPGEDIDNARDLGQADYPAFRDIGDVRLSDEGKKVVLTHRVELDVFHENDFARVGIVDRAVNNFVEILPVSIGQELEGARGPIGRSLQTIALRIFTNGLEQAEKGLFHGSELGCSARSDAANPAFRRLEFSLVIMHSVKRLI